MSGTLSIGELEAILRLRDDLTPALKLVDRELSKSGQHFQQVGGQIEGMGRNMAPLSVGLLAVGGAGMKMATDLNESLANVSALLTDLSGPELDQVVGAMKGKVREMAVDMGKSTTDVSGGLYEVISSLGYTNDTFDQLEISAKAGAAGVATTQEAFNFLASVTKTYGDTSATAFKKAADLGFQAVNFGQTTFPQLSASIGGVAPIAAVAGVEMEELFAIIATATGVTGNTAEVTTQMASAINALLNPSKDLKEMYQQMGIASGELFIKERGLVGALQDVAKYSADTSLPMLELLGRKEGFILTASLAGAQASTFARNLDEMGKAARANGGVIDAAFEKQTLTINAAGFAWKQFKAEVEVALQELGDTLLPIVSRAGQSLKPLWDGARAVLTWFTLLPQPIQTTAVSLAGMLAILSPLLFGLGSFIVMLGAAQAMLATTAAGATGLSVSMFVLPNIFHLMRDALVSLASAQAGSTTAQLAAKAAAGYYKVEILATNAITVVGTGVQRTFAATLLATNINLNVVKASLLSTAAGQAVMNAASVAGSAAMAGAAVAARTLGMALAFCQFVLAPLLAIWAGWKLGPMIADWLGLSDVIERASLRLQRWLGLIDKSTTDQDIYNAVAANTARRTGQVTEQMKAQADEAARLKDQMSGAGLMREMNALQVALVDLTKHGPLSSLALRQIGQAAANLQAQGVTLTPELKNVVAQFDQMTASSGRQTDAAPNLVASLGQVKKEVASLTAEQRRQILAGDQLEMSADEIVAALKKLDPQFKAGATAVKLYVDQYKDGVKTTKAFLEESAKFGREQMQIVGVLGTVEKRAGTYQMELAATKSAVARLTAEQRQQILAGLELGDSVEEVATTMRLSGDVVEAYKNEHTRATQALKSMWQELDRLHDKETQIVGVMGKIEKHAGPLTMVLAATRAEVGRLTESQRENIRAGASMGMTAHELADALGVSEEAVKMFVEMSKGGLSAIADGFTRLGDVSGGALGAWLGGMGKVVVGLDLAIKQNQTWGGTMGVANALFAKGTTASDKWAAALASAGAIAQGVTSIIAATAVEVDRAKNAMSGAVAGAQAGAIFGPWGAAIGGAVGGLVGFVRAGSNARKELAALNKEVADSTKAFKDVHTAVTDVDAVAAMLGVKFNWAPKTRRELDELTAAFEVFNERLDDTRRRFDGLLSGVAELGIGLPAELSASIQHLVDVGLLTDDLAAKFRGLAKEGEADWKRMNAVAEKYGITQEALGKGYLQNRQDSFAEDIINDLELVIQGAADMGGVLFGAREELSEFVNESLRLKTEAPANMQPWLEHLAVSGQLLSTNRLEANALASEILKMAGDIPPGLAPVLESFIHTGDLIDANTGKAMTFDEMMERFGVNASDDVKKVIAKLVDMGNALGDNQGEITDLADLSFKDPIITQFELITSSLRDAVEELRNISAAIAAIPSGKTITIRPDYVDDGPPPGWGDPDRDRQQEKPGYKTGTKGRTGQWFVDFGAGTETELHGREAVVREDQTGAFVADHLASLLRGATPSDGDERPVNLYVAIDANGRARQLTEADRAQVQDWIYAGALDIPERFVSQRGR